MHKATKSILIVKFYRELQIIWNEFRLSYIWIDRNNISLTYFSRVPIILDFVPCVYCNKNTAYLLYSILVSQWHIDRDNRAINSNETPTARTILAPCYN